MHARDRLLTLYDEVQARTRTLAAAHPSWPCARGCGACCRSLARVPELTRAEWHLFEQALVALPQAEREECIDAARQLSEELCARGVEGPCVCPVFDAEGQVCRVYEARPLACRSYGFYAGRSHDAWCQLIAEHVAEVRDTLVLGNLDALEAQLTRLDSERHDLLTWLGIPVRTAESKGECTKKLCDV